jgi:alpha-glucosidase
MLGKGGRKPDEGAKKIFSEGYNIFIPIHPGGIVAEKPWWQTGVIYQIYPRSFADSDGDGTGDLRGVISRLDYLNDGTPRSLGVDALWLSPFFPSPGFDFGYDVSDYYAVDPLFGTLADFDLLLAEAHRRGIRIILDLVLNHTSHLHPWFVQSRSSAANPKRDWYLWQDPKSKDGVPNNWQSVFGGKAWQWDASTRQYYYHMFLAEQPDLNWRNPRVRRAVMNVFRFWLDRGVDGFRLDVADGYFKDALLRDNPPALGIRGYERQKHIYNADRPELLDAYREIRAVLDSYGARMAVGEVMGGPENAARFSGPGLLPLAFNFEFTDRRWNPAAFQDAILRYERLLPEGGWPSLVLSNHDISRHASRYGGRAPEARAKVAAAMLLTLRATPFLYQGEEIGMRDGRLRRSEIQDPPGKKYWPLYTGRDGCRTPIPWTAEPGAGFTTGTPWLPLNQDFRDVNVQAQQDDPDSVLSFYRKLIRLRKKSPALLDGSFRTLISHPDRAMVYLREAGKQTMLVGLNFSDQPARIPLEESLARGTWKTILSSCGGQSDLHGGAGNTVLTLAPNEAAIWIKE